VLALLAPRPLSLDVRRTQHPWLRIQLLLRSMRGTRWDATTWPTRMLTATDFERLVGRA
jgi:hypothetical protein